MTSLYFSVKCKAEVKAMDKAKLSSKNQIVVPKDARETLGVRAGDEIMFVNHRGIIYLLPKPKSFVAALKGMAKAGLKYPKDYLKKERASW